MNPTHAWMSLLSWRIFLFCMFLSFFVVVEPAPTDLAFFIAAICLGFVPLVRARFLNGIAVVGIILYLVSSINSLFFVEINFGFAMRAVMIEFYMIGLFVMTAYFCATKGDEAFFWILMALLIGALLSAFVGYLALADVVPNSDIFFRGEGERNRLKSTFKDPNVFGPFLVPSILFSAWLMVSSRKFYRFGIFCLGCLLLVLVATLSRGAMVHAAISLFILMITLLIYNRSAHPTFLALLAVSAMVCFTGLVFMDQIVSALEGSLFADRLSLQGYDDSRFSHVADATTHILENPFGIGPGQARYRYGYLPHNTFVAFALHNGIAASLGLLLIYMASMARCLMKVLEQNPGWTKYAFVLAVLAGLLVLMQVVGSTHWRHLYVICGMAFGIYSTDAPTDVKPHWHPSGGGRIKKPGLLHRLLTPQGDQNA